MRFFSICLALFTAWAPARSIAQATTPPQAEVTVYSSGSFLKSAIPFNKHAKFAGRIMDGDNQLAMLEFGRFVTFKLDPSEHTLTANSWMIASPVTGGHLKIKLLPGQHFYIGAYLESLTVVSRFRLEQRTCEQAQ